jgi:hypothetical protein
MLNQNYQALSLNVLIFLGACFLASKEVLMFNEEFIVFLCFAVFFIAAYMYGSKIASETFEERSDAIFTEMDKFFESREALLMSLHSHHTNLSKVYDDMSSIHDIVQSQIGGLVGSYESSIASNSAQLITSRLNAFKNKESETQSQIYADYVTWITKSVADEFKNGSDSAKYDEQLVNEAIDHLNALSKDSKVIAKFQF